MTTTPTNPEQARFSLNRWAQRKQAQQQNQTPTPADIAPDAVEDGLSAEEYCQLLPPLETVNVREGIQAFMDSRVTPELKRAAWRKLFGLKQFNVRDGLDDYDLDYTKFEPLGDIVTVEQRYRDALDHAREEEKQRLLANENITDETLTRESLTDETQVLDNADPSSDATSSNATPLVESVGVTPDTAGHSPFPEDDVDDLGEADELG